MSKSSFYNTTATADEMVSVATSASNASDSATQSAASASQSATSAASALSHKNDAETAKTASEAARDASVVAKTASETAKTASESARDTASTHASTATTKASEAATSAQLADDYAVKVNGVVTGSDYSSKAHAVGGTGIDTGVGSAKDWAIKTTGTVGNSSDYSAKYYATSGNVGAVAGALTNINNVAGALTNINTVAGDTSDIGTLAGLSTQLGLLGTTDAVSDMNALANITSDVSALAGALEQTYTTTVAGGVFVLGGSNNPAIEMFRGSSYTFNQNDMTNDGHPLVFKNGSSAYQDGVTYYLNGAVTSYANYINTTTFNAGRSSGDRKVVIEVQSTAPSSGLRYYCYIHGNGMGNTITVKDSNISLVATNIANVNLTGGSITNVNAVAGNATNINAVANNSTNINTVAGDATEIAAVANNATNINAVAGNATNINAVAGNSTNINAVNSNSTNINSVAGNSTNINAVAGATTNVNTVATNISSINDFADKYRIGSSDPGSSNDEGDLFYNTTSNVLKVYTGSAWEAGVTAGSGFAALSGATFSGDVTFTGDNYNAVWDKSDNALEFADNAKATFGTGADLTIRHDSSNNSTYIEESGSGHLLIKGDDVVIQNSAGSVNLARFNDGGAVQLFQPNSNTVRFATTSTGVDVTGNMKADTISIDHASNDWNFELDGADLIIKNGSTTLFKLDTSGNLTVAGDITTDGSL
tara:strand:- start:2311 stop:4437 length:2127 start_codon:yes stop_codon:yes gene_type:complete